MNDLERDGERSLTDQIVGAFRGAIEAGELAPGEKLPPTRELAETAGVNHLTAVRAYKRLRELGLVSSQVGRGTFVRDSAPAVLPAPGDADATDWQHFVLPPLAESHGDRVMAEMYRHSQARGLIPLSVGYPSSKLFPFDEIRRALDACMDDRDARALQYTDIAGEPDLVEELAALSAQRGSPEDPGDIVVTTGARQGLTLAARAILRPGDAVACEAPTFMGVLESVKAIDTRVLPVPMDEQGLDVDALEELLGREQIRFLAIQPRCHNPTGQDLAPARRTQLLELAHRHGFFIVEDGIYGDLRYDGEDPGSLRAEARGHVIYIDSVSKTVGGGLRVGWIAASGPVRERILVEKRADDMHSPTLTQLAVAGFLAAGEYPAHIERARDFYRERRDVLLEATGKHLKGLATVATQSPGGGHLWLTLDLPLNESELISEAVRNGVTFVPGAAMLPTASHLTHMRLSYGFLEPDQLVEGTRRLARAIRSLAKRPRVSEALPIA
ncbi:MAG TPA: PLP-dependent aminotransferase family protein [Solirubrobacterales bacterium]|nr:PLP-dependent aminotransferase family protein [Solirubrobacterales bacterium]